MQFYQCTVAVGADLRKALLASHKMFYKSFQVDRKPNYTIVVTNKTVKAAIFFLQWRSLCGEIRALDTVASSTLKSSTSYMS